MVSRTLVAIALLGLAGVSRAEFSSPTYRRASELANGNATAPKTYDGDPLLKDALTSQAGAMAGAPSHKLHGDAHSHSLHSNFLIPGPSKKDDTTNNSNRFDKFLLGLGGAAAGALTGAAIGYFLSKRLMA